MAREFAKKFYSSAMWQDCRNGYAAYKGYLCENCLAKGIYREGEIVHHKIELDPVNINKPEIALSWDNLCLLCRKCHAEQHRMNIKDLRYHIGDNGEVIIDGIL